MQGKMARADKTRASRQVYTSTKQSTLPGFETPFIQKLSPTNRWVVLADKIPWDHLVKIYQKQMHNSHIGADGVNPRVVLGAIMIKHMLDLSDRETILQIQENMYLQYFIGLSSYSNEEVFDASLFVEFRKRLGANQVNEINETILKLGSGGLIGREPQPVVLETVGGVNPSKKESEEVVSEDNDPPTDQADTAEKDGPEDKNKTEDLPEPAPCAGKMIIDATACPQDIRYPTDLDVLNDAREKSEELIDALYVTGKDKVKPRTYRVEAHKFYLQTAQKKTKTKKEIRNAVKKQLGYLRRNLKHIDNLLAALKSIPLNRHQYKYLLVIRTVYAQQAGMYKDKTHKTEHRIVSIHQPHVRPIVRGKTVAKTEFGAKINVSLVNGLTFLEDLSWEAYNESTRLMEAVERYKKRFGYYPKDLLADKIYCTRDNRAKLKLLGIALKAKPLGRPKAVKEHVRPGERNPIEGKFGQAKSAYGMNRIKARLQQTSQSWIASIIMVLNLVKLAGQVPFALCLAVSRRFEKVTNQYKTLFYIDYFKINLPA
jgi:IS5 family transposase